MKAKKIGRSYYVKHTLYNFQHKNPELIDRKEQLKQIPILKARKTVVDAWEGNLDLALKYLERKKRDEFSTKQIVGAEVITIEDKLRALREKNDRATAQALSEE